MPSRQHFASGLMVATALIQFDVFQIEAVLSLWIFTHATCWANAESSLPKGFA